MNEIFGELKFDEPIRRKFSRENLNNGHSSTSTNFSRVRFPPRRGPRPTGPGFSSFPTNSNFPRAKFPMRDRISSRPLTKNDIEVYPNNRHRWFVDFKEIPRFLCVFDNRHRSKSLENSPFYRHDHLLFVSDDRGLIGVFNIPKEKSMLKPTLIRSGELFSKNSSLLLEAFAVYDFAIVVFVRRFEQRSNEIEHTKLIRAGLPIMSGEQVRCQFVSSEVKFQRFRFFESLIIGVDDLSVNLDRFSFDQKRRSTRRHLQSGENSNVSLNPTYEEIVFWISSLHRRIFQKSQRI